MKDELRVLFKKTTSEPWSPQSTLVARILGIIESNGEANVPASQIVHIGLETKLYSKEVLQIGLADLKGAKVLDCLTRYSKGVIAPSSSNLSKDAIQRQKQNEKKVKGYHTHHGTLDAKSVVTKLRKNGINKDTIFVAWALWPFDLSYLRRWLRQEGFADILPGDENICLLIPEFRANINRVLGKKCFQGRSFPLSLPVVFPLFCGPTHELLGRNHHALYDSQQLSLMMRLFLNLQKHPDERTPWQNSEFMRLGSRKRQMPIEESLALMSIPKRVRHHYDEDEDEDEDQ
ncbi:unnamed protein product [Penicillium nalgiovense]|nr:unnamed protein product [Penicillium nalgiovense]